MKADSSKSKKVVSPSVEKYTKVSITNSKNVKE